MAAVDAVKFIISSQGDTNPPGGFFKDFSEDLPCRSVLQRTGKTLEEVLEMFDWRQDNDKWTEEYNKPGSEQDTMKMIKYRRRVCFCIGGWREFNEDFGRGDVSCMRDIVTPVVTSRSPLKAAKDEFDD